MNRFLSQGSNPQQSPPLGPPLIQGFTRPHDEVSSFHNDPSMNKAFASMGFCRYLMCSIEEPLGTGNGSKQWVLILSCDLSRIA